MATMTTLAPRRDPARRHPARWLKLAVWSAMLAMTLSVMFFSELPLMRAGTASRAHILDIRWMLVPHLLGALLALGLGAVQFSSRLRRWSLRWHRIAGRVYVGSICVAGPMSIVMSYGTAFFVATLVQAGAWLVTAIAAMLTARRRRMELHRQWVVRSYGVTFGFILLHVMNPLRFWSGMGDSAYATAIIICTFLAVLVPDVVFSWSAMANRQRV